MTIFAIHEHELKKGVNELDYERDVYHALSHLSVPGLRSAKHLKGFKGKRNKKYTVLWEFDDKQSIIENFGTSDNPKWPKDWLYYENEVLAKYLDRHPDKIDYTDFDLIKEISY